MGHTRRQFLTGGVGVAAALATHGLPIAPAWAADALAVSVGKVDITPATGTYMAGFGTDKGQAPRVASGVRDLPLYARCTVLWDGGYPNVIVSVDVLGFGEATNRAIRSRLAGVVSGHDLILTATHTHCGPVLTERLHPRIAYDITDLSSVRAYENWLIAAIVDLVTTTLAGIRVPCTLDYQVADENLVYNREGLSYVERDVPILVARGGSGAPVAVLFGWGCHPTTAGGDLFDPDYPGEAISWIEDTTGAHAQFLLGPAGDQDPVRGATRNEIGEDLGKTVINAIATPGRAISGPIQTSYSRVNLPLDITDEPANLQLVRAAYAARQGDASLPAWYWRHAKEMITQIDDRSFATSVSLPVQAWTLAGDEPLRLALVGGELVSGYGAYFRQRYGGSNGIWVAGYANEVPAYIPSDELLQTGGLLQYACGWYADHPGIAGGSMTVYGWLGHFRGRPVGSSVDGVEQILIGKLTSML